MQRLLSGSVSRYLVAFESKIKKFCTCTGLPNTRAKSPRCNSFSASFSLAKTAIRPHGVSETRHVDSGSEAAIASSR